MGDDRPLKAKELYPAVFSRHAVAYQRRLDEIMSKGEARGRLRLIELVEARPGMRILDLACGPGTLSRLLAVKVAPGGSVVGIDLASGMIDAARRTSPPNATFEKMDMEHLLFPDADFDAAVCGHGLQFAPDLGQALREARRVLRAGGLLCSSIPVSNEKDSVWELIDSVVDQWLPPPPTVVDDKATRATVGEPGRLKAAALDAGFATAEVETIEEEVVWESAEHLVSMFMGWWDFAFRIEGMEPLRRQAFMDEATETVRRTHPGEITTRGQTSVMCARA